MTKQTLSKDFEKLRRVAIRLHERAAKYHAEGQAVRPERLYVRALELQQTLLGPEHPEIAHTLNNLALYYKALGRLAEARPLYERALAMFRKTRGASHADTAATMHNLAQLLKAMSREMEQRARQTEKDAREMTAPAEAAKAVIREDLMRYRLHVAQSRIHRFGVFALEHIPANRRIIPYIGEMVGRRESVLRGAGARIYLLRVDKYWRIDGSVGGSGAELINHSCEPNCRFDIRGHAVWIVSLRKIVPGEELKLDYRFSHRQPAVPCYCGASACRGTINVKRFIVPLATTLSGEL
jgi:hypothetical protein